MEYNGGSVVAMVGKDCVAIASDLRLGSQSLGISSNFQKVNISCVRVQTAHLVKGLSDNGSHILGPAWTRDRCNDTVC